MSDSDSGTDPELYEDPNSDSDDYPVGHIINPSPEYIASIDHPLIKIKNREFVEFLYSW